MTPKPKTTDFDSSRRVPPERLRWTCDPSRFPFGDTSELEGGPIEIIGQPRAMEALELGLEVRAEGYNIFVAGDVGTGRSTAVRRVLAKLGNDEPTPEDLVYVHNFRDSDRPRLLAFPAGRGSAFRAAMAELLETLRKSVPDVFESEQYRERRAGLIESAKERHKARLKEYEERVEKEGFALVQVKLGPLVRPELMPVVADNPVDLDKLEELTSQGKFPRDEFEKLKAQHAQLAGDLETLSKELRNLQRDLKSSLDELDRKAASPLVRDAVDDLREGFPADEVRGWLDEVVEDMLSRLATLRGFVESAASAEMEPAQLRQAEREIALPYLVNVVVDNSGAKGRPVLWESSPSFRNLFGTIERAQEPSGQWRTDHTRIKAGSLVRANGGFLVLDALDVLVEPGVWPALKRSLRTRVQEIQSYDPMFFFGGVSLKPEPVHLDVKVVLIGTKHIYGLLSALDEDFRKIFKIKAEFALETDLSDDELANYASFVKKKCEDDDLPPFSREAVASVVEHALRLAGRRGKLTTRFNVMADVIRESGYWARREGGSRVEPRDVGRALEKRRWRHDMVEQKLREWIAEGTLLIDIEGRKVGQVNGLAVLDVGDHVFGQPARITAVTAMGRAGIINIERESEMSGSIHTKGTLILAGLLRDRFAQDRPLTLSASLAFEQHYGMIDGDSASSSELYALLSSLSGIPIRQGIAVTGSVNQKGEIQPIGGINQKVEGFFDICRTIGIDGEQGVLVPSRNLAELMLRADVVAAVAEGRFHVFAASTIEEGIEVLTGVAAGERRPDGAYPEDSVLGRADARLRRLSEELAAYGAADLRLGT